MTPTNLLMTAGLSAGAMAQMLSITESGSDAEHVLWGAIVCLVGVAVVALRRASHWKGSYYA